MANILLDSTIMHDILQDVNNREELVPVELKHKGVQQIYYNAKETLYTIVWQDYRKKDSPKMVSKIQINKEGFAQFSELFPDVLYNED